MKQLYNYNKSDRLTNNHQIKFKLYIVLIIVYNTIRYMIVQYVLKPFLILSISKPYWKTCTFYFKLKSRLRDFLVFGFTWGYCDKGKFVVNLGCYFSCHLLVNLFIHYDGRGRGEGNGRNKSLF